MNLNISYLSYDNTDQKLYNRSVEILDNLLGSGNYQLGESESNILFIASGGSEKLALNMVDSKNNFILLCHRENNSFAAAMEIAAYIRTKNKRVELIDVMAENALDNVVEVNQISQALEDLSGQRAALIGEVSDWLIISDIDKELIKSKLGIDMIKMPWSELDSYKEKTPSQELISSFPDETKMDLKETSKVYTLLDETVTGKSLTAISVECFSLVKRDKVTACLPLAVLNNKNVVAACEGDICSMIGKMLVRAVTDQIPWQANVAEIKEDHVLFAHCTAPLNLLKSFEITTHFETGCGTAVRGRIDNQAVGVFRINNTLDKYMLLDGEIIGNPNHNYACRTQIEFKSSPEKIILLKDKALGNHHLVLPARYISIVNRLMQFLGIEKVQ
jgi:L-fucose isomerase-like protein